MGDTPQTRSSLLLRIRDPGDGEAWDEFAGIYTPLIHRYCQRRGLQDADAADVAQEVMLAVSGAIGRFELKPIKGSFRSWLFRITHNTFADFLERRNRGPQGGGGSTVRRIVEAQPDPAAEDLWHQEYQRYLFDWVCRQVRGHFEESTWQAFWRTAVEKEKGEDVARALGISVGAVHIAKSRVLARMKEKVREVSDDSPFLEGN
jgi:RNA polymerase sigma-70 factor (ECF subfamily)